MLKLENVRKTYGAVVAVDDLTLTVRRGEVFGFLGPNGSGKSTTVNLSVGLIASDRGRVSIEGRGTADEPAVRARRRCAAGAGALRPPCPDAKTSAFSEKSTDSPAPVWTTGLNGVWRLSAWAIAPAIA
jgi:energy-coupling factor transporter ATP-binding protein EcfA2